MSSSDPNKSTKSPKEKMKKILSVLLIAMLCMATTRPVAEAMVDTSVFTSGPLKSSLFQPCEKQGTLETISYSMDYGSKEITKTCKVYLPYNYDPKGHYNVVLLIHGFYGSRDSFFTEPVIVKGIRMTGRDLYDNLFSKGRVAPTILVGMDTNYNGKDMPPEVLGQEIREHIIPEVVRRYATWAKSPAIEDIVAARDHFAVYGQSNGSLRVYDTCLVPNKDIFSSYACISGTAKEDERYILNSVSDSDYPVKMLFMGAGSLETHSRKTTEIFNETLEKTNALQEGENAVCYVVDGAHDWATWYAELYNFLTLID